MWANYCSASLLLPSLISAPKKHKSNILPFEERCILLNMNVAQQEATAKNHAEKLKHLATLSEDAFRDQVVRPLFLRQGMTDYRDLCGPDERGKDCILTIEREFGRIELTAIQTKKGKLTHSRRDNVDEAITQLRTALAAPIPLSHQKIVKKPDRVYLAASGTIGTNTREHIHRELKDQAIEIIDGNDVINLVDKHYPEYWQGIDSKRFPYLRALRGELAAQSDAILVMDLATGRRASVPVTDEAYVPQFVYRPTNVLSVKRGHRVVSRPDFEEIADKQLLDHQTTVALITGEGGSGKSTMLRRLAYILSEKGLSFAEADKPRVPCY